MKTKIFILFLLVALTGFSAHSQHIVSTFSAKPNGVVEVAGRLEDGSKMEDLSWAWSSQNACFVSTKQHKFSGNHVLYQTEIPPRSEMTIRVIPRDKNADFSLYAYSGGGGAVVPNLPYCTSCEADYKWDFKRRGKTQDHTRSVQLRAINNPFPVTIGVVGGQGLSSGDFILEVSLEGGETPENKPQPDIPIFRIDSEKGKSLTYEGKLKEGVFVYKLDWAWDGQNACFPSTQKDKYEGHHQLYLTELPRRSELTVTLIPDNPKDQLNLYAYSIGSELQVVPDLHSCVSCEASYMARSGRDPGIRQVELRAINNPYQVVIGVAGAKGVTSGSYRLELSLK
ncbi:hypothetical protein [Flavilitoribacter nigricans]|uniref:Uncharacterized protein n=1 Tax=Flavilitoribacter nigricans (strain ATCC 23147 / DSM 23189 / NBRC 102662 / NCIMB 1420 / SS-2) TaxID=1122177 RepID=A0A2D0N6G5_FLAN2|nr:hypothetical protein [Flavilitoribacter nigricans]PHN03980.1 hypothetical protein CRP01_24220 [Flavilitoribacter nigricans DSM 23189 = NBRC 102662]